MNRLSFLKKLGIGAAAVVIAPKVLIPPEKTVLTTGGVISHLAKRGKLRYSAHKLSQPSLIRDMMPYMEQIQCNWLEMQIALDKQELEGFKKKYQ